VSVWPRVRLGEVLTQVARPEAVDAGKAYKMLGVRWYGGGLFVKDALFGHQIAAQKVYAVHEGDFVYNRLFAWKGSFAVAGIEADGCYVSNEFPCFAANADRLDANFLRWLFRRESTWSWALGLSTGATPTSRNRLKEEAFLSLEIPLPPPAEQQRIVARIDQAATDGSLIASMGDAVVREADEICRAVLRVDERSYSTAMRDIVDLRSPDVAVRADENYHFAGVYSFGRGVFVGEQKSGLEFSYSKLTRLRSGDFVYPKLMAWEGAFGIVPPECDGLVVSTEFPVFKLRLDRVLPEVLDTYFRDPALWPNIAGSSIGTNVRRRRLNPSQFLEHRMPLPAMPTQLRLREVKHETERLKAAQAARRAELDALLPAVLDRAFAGAL
jgi:type I restriction enzyme S subunit